MCIVCNTIMEFYEHHQRNRSKFYLKRDKNHEFSAQMAKGKTMEFFSFVLCLKQCEASVQFINTLVMIQNVM